VCPIGGTRHGTYAANWTYDTCIPVLDIRMWPRENIAGLELINEDVSLLRGVDYDIPALNRSDRILIPPKYTFFSKSQTAKNSGVKRA
jgi:hypothetical protein